MNTHMLLRKKKKASLAGPAHLRSPERKALTPAATSTFQESNTLTPTIQLTPLCPCGGGCPRCVSAPPIQAKLMVGRPNDKYEQEADRIAEEVMRMPGYAIKPKPT